MVVVTTVAAAIAKVLAVVATMACAMATAVDGHITLRLPHDICGGGVTLMEQIIFSPILPNYSDNHWPRNLHAFYPFR